ncbi:hypothetical protein KEJ27_06570 [Candidatus Bathyarchaeota archaeon]|nr:hypothetical protein [Candidatus Bathyarchaeota archaeon]MBS7618712.1 hypothetical protein [Candidatus Bathyarchaeota archaeon]
MRKSILISGLVLIVLGAVIIGFGLQLSSQYSMEAGEWQVTWYSMQTPYGVWGDAIATGRFPTIFSYDPLEYSYREEPIGFKAFLEVNVPRDVTVQFTIGGDDGDITIFLDGDILLNLPCPDPNVQQSIEAYLSAGRHTLEIEYYQVLVEDDAAALFNMVISGQQEAMGIATGGGALVFIGIILALLGFLLKPKKI